MADKRAKKSRKADKENEKATKEEYAVAKFLRFNCPTKEAKFVPMQNMVHCFYGNKAIDTLLESKWAKASKGDITFTDRKSCVFFLERLMVKGLFHRATKVERSKKDRGKRKKKEEENGEEEKEKDKKSKKDKKGKDKEEEVKTDDSVSKTEEKKDEEKKKDDDKKKKEKKLRLDMADEQRFLDGEEVYVWIYDPVPVTTFIIGLLMVAGAAALCLFPLWPDWMRGGVYYVSLLGASFVGLILMMVMVRSILFGVLWLFTLGTLHFWLLPNLTEDVGFFESFKPTYTYSIYGRKDSEKEDSKKNKDKSKKGSDKKKGDKTESESETNDQEQGYEMVQKEDVEEGEGGTEEEEDGGEENNEDLSEEMDGEGDEEDDQEEEEDNEPKKTK